LQKTARRAVSPRLNAAKELTAAKFVPRDHHSDDFVFTQENVDALWNSPKPGSPPPNVNNGSP
jgi:hypothetical protein